MSSSLAWVRSTVTPLKSNRVPTSRRTWSSALRSSCSSKSLTTSNDWSPAIDPPLPYPVRRRARYASTRGTARSARPPPLRGQEPGRAGRRRPAGPPHEAACQAARIVVPETQWRSTVNSTSRLRCSRLEQVCPERIVADERRLERVLMVLGVVREQRDPAVAVERLPRPPVRLEPVRRPPHSRSSRPPPVAPAAVRRSGSSAPPPITSTASPAGPRRPASPRSPRPSPGRGP